MLSKLLLRVGELTFFTPHCGFVEAVDSCRIQKAHAAQKVLEPFGVLGKSRFDGVKRRQGDVPWDAVHRTLQL